VLTIFYPVFLIAALAQATPAPVPTTVPEIGRTHAKTFCERIQDNTSATVDATLRNNQSLDAEIIALQRTSGTDFSSDLSREHWDKAVTRYATDMNAELKVARVQLDELRDLASKTPDDAFRKEINAYVDALDKAQGEQAKIARATLVGLTIGSSREALAGEFKATGQSQASVDASNGYAGGDADDPRSPRNVKTREFHLVAQAFAQMVPGIVASENQAALHAPKLLAACGQANVSPDPDPSP
jgi:hypothetical protein